jgi:branched-chain amino acid transport system permease protein
VRIWLAYLGYAAVLGLAPLLWTSGFALTLLAQTGIAIIACLAYHLIFGLGGMTSFGHAIYSGLGAYAVVYALNALGAAAPAGAVVWVALLPLLGGLAGLFSAALLGYLTTRQGGTTFAMITLGLGELVWALAQMLPDYFGGEGGISTNRVIGVPLWGISWGPQRQMVGLIAAYCFVSTLLLAGFAQTPLGYLLRAVRDNPQRVEYLGVSAHQVRWQAFMVSGFFMGVAGGLAALNFELVSTEMLGAPRSAAYLLFVVLGGSTLLAGPILGAVLMVLALVLLSSYLQGWLMYLGLLFMLVLRYFPAGLAGMLLAGWQGFRQGQLRDAAGPISRAVLAWALLLGALVVLVEMAYQHQQASQLGSVLRLAGFNFDSAAPLHWFAAAAAGLLGLAGLRWPRRALSGVIASRPESGA